jgi:hypothetical protein
MSRYFVNLPAAQMPRNAMMDFSPVNNALSGIREQNNQNRQFGMQEQQMAEQREQRQYQRGRDQQQDARQQVEWFGKTAAAIDRLEGPARQAAWQNALQRHPDSANLTPDYLDPMQGPKLVMAEAGQWRDPREDQMADLNIQTQQAKLGLLQSQIARANEPGNDTPEARAAVAARYGIDPNSPEGRQFVLTGKYEGKPQFTPAETAVDRNYAKSYEADVASGGFADMQKNIDQLAAVRDELTDPRGANLTGPVLGRLPDFVTAFTNPKAIDARERVEEVVQRNLRLILGAQFTQKEGERLIARAYNPNLDEATNARRVSALVGAMQQAMDAKRAAAAHYEQFGTMKGFKGRVDFSAQDFENAIEGSGQGNRAAPSPGGAAGGFKYIGPAD